MKYVLDISAIVFRDMENIRGYIAKDSPSAAKKVSDKLFRAIEKLEESPLIHVELNKKFDVDTDLRGCAVKPYVILFKVTDRTVKVYRVLDGRSDYLAKLGLKDSVDLA